MHWRACIGDLSQDCQGAYIFVVSVHWLEYSRPPLPQKHWFVECGLMPLPCCRCGIQMHTVRSWPCSIRRAPAGIGRAASLGSTARPRPRCARWSPPSDVPAFACTKGARFVAWIDSVQTACVLTANDSLHVVLDCSQSDIITLLPIKYAGGIAVAPIGVPLLASSPPNCSEAFYSFFIF